MKAADMIEALRKVDPDAPVGYYDAEKECFIPIRIVKPFQVTAYGGLFYVEANYPNLTIAGLY